MRLVIAMIVCCLPLLLMPSSQTPAVQNQAGADWPLFRGDPLQTGVASEALPGKLEVRWKVELKKGIESTAAIVKDTVYVGCFDDHLYAFELATGKPRWKTKLGPISAPVSVYQGKVFVGDEDGKFHCVEAASGKPIWSFEIDAEITGGANFAGDKVIFGGHDSTLYCLDIKTKAVQWTVKIEGGPVKGSAVIANGKTFVAGCDSNLHVIDVKTGKTDAKIELSGQVAATTTVRDKTVYVGNMNNEMQAIDLVKKDALWSCPSKRGQAFYSSAAVTDKLVVVGNRDKLVYALDRLTGKPVWTFPADRAVDCSPVIAGDRVYFGSTGGTFYVVDLAKGKLLESMPLGQGIIASPAVAHGCLVIGTTDGVLYCFGKK